MNIQVAVLCDAATDDHGKLNLLGAFDTLITRQLPAVHPQCSIALRISFHAMDEGDHKLRLAVVDADGRPIMQPMEVEVQVRLPEDTHFVTRNFIFNIQQMRFQTAGVYSVDVFLGGQQKAGIPLLVRHNPPAPEPGEEWKAES